MVVLGGRWLLMSEVPLYRVLCARRRPYSIVLVADNRCANASTGVPGSKENAAPPKTPPRILGIGLL